MERFQAYALKLVEHYEDFNYHYNIKGDFNFPLLCEQLTYYLLVGMMTNFDTYIKKIEEDLRRGSATEYTYRGSLELFIESFAKGIDASNDPKHIECGAPDFIVEKRKVPLGYVETKDVGVDLDRVEKSDQMKRYLKALHNLILTDYLEFRWYVNGQKRQTIQFATVGKNNKLVVNPNGEQAANQLFRDFFRVEAPTVNTPKELAVRLAEVTHFIKDQITAALESGDFDTKKALEAQYKVFVDLLLPALTPAEFADLYAQTITYGLFAAKMGAEENQSFTLEDAYKYLKRIPFLRRLFQDVNEQLDEIDIIRPYLQDIVSLLNRSNMQEILADFGHRTRTEDPVVHFYETFLATYDPKMRESRGVYYTPEPVVKFIVNSVEEILKTRFNKPWGLADESVKVLDPATGTGTFLYYVIQKIHDEIVNVRGQGGQWQEKSKAALKRLYGFELLIAPYVISHLKLGLLMDSLGAPLEGKDERMHVYLTNTLEEGVERAEMLAGLGSNIAEESSEAAKVKKMDDIMVVLGNPPYSGNSSNASKNPDGSLNFIGKLLKEYYFVDGSPLGERNPKWLQDDYVKFIRYGEGRINKSGKGVLAFITNHGYLDNPTFRGMRQHLMRTFDEIYVLDLHGNSKKKETTPEGGKDENVFDIQSGVAILLAIKLPNNLNVSDIYSKVYRMDFWGKRNSKYNELTLHNLQDIKWAEVVPEKPYYLFIPQDTTLNAEYLEFWGLDKIFFEYSPGITTGQDDKTIAFSQSEAEIFAKKLGIQKEKIKTIAYRPMDSRKIIYDKKVVTRDRQKIMQYMFNGDNLALVSVRKAPQSSDCNYFYVCNDIIINGVIRSDNQSIDMLFPLYRRRISEPNNLNFFENAIEKDKLNISLDFITQFAKKLNLQFTDCSGDLKTTFSPEDIFHYLYAILYCQTYRTRYAEFLKIDFPRVPLTNNNKLFKELVERGKELVNLHLLKSPKVEQFITTYPISGDNKVEKVVYVDSKVMINSTQYFGGVPEEIWNFKIGGYQVCEKWLKDRKGRTLSSEDISHYQRVVVALKETIRLMKEIDEVIPGFPIE